MFISLMVVWVLLVWPFDGGVAGGVWQDIVAGAVVALVVTLVMREFTRERAGRWLNPVRIFWAVVYLVLLVVEIIRANFDVAYRVLHPKMPIRPGIVKVKTTLKTETAITALANSITLTPGTLTVDASEDGELYVHWINVKTSDVEGATRAVVARFERVLAKVFE